MRRNPLVFALALALPFSAITASVHAADLMQTYELARSGDPQLAAAESDRLAQKEGAVQARAALLPQISGDATFNRSRSEIDGVPGSSTNSSRGYGIGLNQSVLDFSRYSALRGQRALSQAADFDLEAANDSLITRTSAAYFNVLVAIETLAAAEAQQTALQKQFDYAQKRLDVGLAPITDVHEARAQFDSARANVILSRNALQDAYQALAEITGQPVGNLKGLPSDFRPELPSDYDAEGWVSTAIAQNPALKSLEYQVQSADANVSTARAGHLPTLSLGGSWGKDRAWGDSTVGTVVGDSTGTSVGLTLSVPIFAGGATQSRVRQAIANRDSTQDFYEQQKRAIVRNTRNAYQTLEAGISEIEARRLALVSARAAYEASQVGLEVGTRTVLDVLINQQNLFNAQQQYALSRYNYLQNRLLLDQAAGTLDVDDVQAINRLLTVDAEAQLAPAAP
jgi:outer membrane protein